MNDEYVIRTIAQLESVVGSQIDKIKEKVSPSLDEAMIDFIGRSPLLLLATIDAQGRLDVSPKGDAPGFVNIDSNGNLLVPDRPGNRLTYGFRNILRNNKVGLIFLLPGMRETLRVKGSATISKDPALLQKLSQKNKPALLCTHVSVSECFFHCGKAMIRSHMWQPDKWAKHEDSLMLQSMAKRYGADQQGERDIEAYIEQSYRDNLY